MLPLNEDRVTGSPSGVPGRVKSGAGSPTPGMFVLVAVVAIDLL